MSAQHTPGPWRVTPTPHSSYQNFIVQMGRSSVSVYTDNDEADARLIAAAPELLEALIKCVEQLEVITGMVHEERCALLDARLAIAKATAAQTARVDASKEAV